MSLNSLSPQSLSLEPAIDSNFLVVESDVALVDVLAMMGQLRNSCKIACALGEPHPGQSEAPSPFPSSENFPWSTILDSNFVLEPTTVDTGCILVMEGSKLLGIFTERDIVRLMAQGETVKAQTIREAVTHPVITIQESEAQDIFTALSIFRQHHIRHLPVLDDEEKPIGVITHDSIRRALQPVNLLTRLRSVEDVMTEEVIYASPQVSVLQLAQFMTQHRVSCVVICEQSSSGKQVPVGIVTERDLVQFQSLALNLAHTQAHQVMSTPLFTLSPQASVWVAHETMNRQRVRRLVVVGHQGELAGIISQTSLLQALNPADMYGMIDVLQQAVEERTAQLEESNAKLRHEVAEREKAQTALRAAHDHLKLRVEERTAQLKQANRRLEQDLIERHQVEAALRLSETQLRRQTKNLQQTLEQLQRTQVQLVQTEKMSSLGQLVAGIAHEVNNPINFIYGNFSHAEEYIRDLLSLVNLYHQNYPNPVPEIQAQQGEIELDFLQTDLMQLLVSMRRGIERIRDLVVSLRSFARLDEADLKTVDLHEGLDSTLLILQSKLNPRDRPWKIKVSQDYGDLPRVECYPGRLNQVFLHVLSNAIEAIEEKQEESPGNENSSPQAIPEIKITTAVSTNTDRVIIRVMDNGTGMDQAVRQRLFDPFFTTKPVGQGTGLGLSISYQIVVDKHQGQLDCCSTLGEGTELTIELPVNKTVIPEKVSQRRVAPETRRESVVALP